jgi:hypothetical protein
MTLNDLTGPGVAVFSDPAGAKAALSVASLVDHREGRSAVCRLFSNRAYPFFEEWNHPVAILSTADDLPWKETRPQWVFTGTSHPDSSAGFEIEVIRHAKRHGIPTVSFIDHYTNYRRRFEKAGELILPDCIWVLDEKARAEAGADGLPAHLLRIQSNPYLEYIRLLWKPCVTRRHILESLALPRTDLPTALWLYAPDPISFRSIGQWGFDETTVLLDLLKALEETRDTVLWLRPHPLQPLDKLLPIIEAHRSTRGNTVVCNARFPGLDMAYAADCIVGFHSNFLLEAVALGRPVLRYFPSTPERDAFSHLNLGTVIRDPFTLRRRLVQLNSTASP